MAQTESSISRRDLLRKGAVAGAVAWTAPVVLSSPAFAATGKCSGSKPCVDFYFAHFDTAGSVCGTEDGSCPDPDITKIACPNTTPTLQGACNQGVTVSYDDTTGTITLPAGAILVAVNVKTGGGSEGCHWVYANDNGAFSPLLIPTNQGTCTFTITAASGPNGTTVWTVSKSGECQGAGLSHLSVVFCK